MGNSGNSIEEQRTKLNGYINSLMGTSGTSSTSDNSSNSSISVSDYVNSWTTALGSISLEDAAMLTSNTSNTSTSSNTGTWSGTITTTTNGTTGYVTLPTFITYQSTPVVRTTEELMECLLCKLLTKGDDRLNLKLKEEKEEEK